MKIKVFRESNTLEITDDNGKPLEIPVCALDIELRPSRPVRATIETECFELQAMIGSESIEVDFERVAGALRGLADKVAGASAADAFKLRTVAALLASLGRQGGQIE